MIVSDRQRGRFLPLGYQTEGLARCIGTFEVEDGTKSPAI
jgi:hypothetical protein